MVDDLDTEREGRARTEGVSKQVSVNSRLGRGCHNGQVWLLS